MVDNSSEGLTFSFEIKEIIWVFGFLKVWKKWLTVGKYWGLIYIKQIDSQILDFDQLDWVKKA